MQHEENGCEKVFWPFSETKKGSSLKQATQKFRNLLT